MTSREVYNSRTALSVNQYTWLWVTAIQLEPYAHPTLWIVVRKNFDKPGLNRIKPVYHGSEVVTVAFKYLHEEIRKKQVKL